MTISGSGAPGLKRAPMGARFKPGAYEAKTIPLVLHVDVIILLLRLPLFTKAMTTKGP